jgi:hypothetical protein
MTEGVGVALGVGEGVGVALGVGEGVGKGFETFTPLLHMNFFPDFRHLYLKPPEMIVEFSFAQEEPALTAALETPASCVKKIETKRSTESRRFICKG